MIKERFANKEYKTELKLVTLIFTKPTCFWGKNKVNKNLKKVVRKDDKVRIRSSSRLAERYSVASHTLTKVMQK